MGRHSCVFQRPKRHTCCVTHSGDGEGNLKTAVARKVAIAPGDFEVNFSKVISCQILKVNICEQEGASKQTAVLGISEYLFSLFFPGVKWCIYSIEGINTGAGIKGEIWLLNYHAWHNAPCHKLEICSMILKVVNKVMEKKSTQKK